MASLAGLLRARGHEVTGSDEGVYPPMSEMLDELGIAYARTYDPSNLHPRPDRVVVGNAVSRGNPELEAVLDLGLRFTSSAAVLRDEFLWGRHVLAVAGTHGKTTTTSLLAWLLECAGRDPSFLVGGVAENFGSSFRWTGGEHFVVEADEYDTAFFDKGPKMWHYLPRTAVVTNVEFDHADIYRDRDAYEFAFERFVNLVPRAGALVLGWGEEGAPRLAGLASAAVESFAYAGQGGEDGPEGEVPRGLHPMWTAEDVEQTPDGTSFTLVRSGTALGRVRTPLFGAFNVRNCLAAAAAAHTVGAPPEAIREGLRTFRSVRRRMEVRGTPRGVAVVDDFAHHPTAVAGSVEAVRQRFPQARVWAILEPRSYTAQRRESRDGFAAALAGADRSIVGALHRPERYDASTGLDPDELARILRDRGGWARHLARIEEIVELVGVEARPGDVVLVMSNGAFGGIVDHILDRLDGVDGA